jgi:hypothetical protein
MKVYFTACARGTDSFGDFYEEIYKTIENNGFNHVDTTPACLVRPFSPWTQEDKAVEYKKSMKCVKECDFVVLELSMHSLSMGFIMHQALELKKPVICLYTQSNMPHFANVIESSFLSSYEYGEENLVEQVEKGLRFAKKLTEVV